MGKEFVYGQDAFCAPIKIDSTNNKITVLLGSSGAAPQTVTVPPGSYHNVYDDKSLSGSTLAGLPRAIRDALISSGSAFTVSPATPPGSGLDLGGSEISRGAGFFRLEFTTLDPRLLGFPAGTAFADSDGSGTLISPLSRFGVWQSYTLSGDHAATDKRTRPHQNIVLSSDDVAVAARKKYIEKKFRTFQYDYVPGAHVRSNRARDTASANTAGLAVGDVHNALEDFWRLATESDEDGRMGQVLIIHDEWNGGDSYDEWELARLSNVDQIQKLDNIIKTVQMAGEYYQVKLDVDVFAGTYDQ